MKIKLLTEAQAINLNQKFTDEVWIQPFPLKNGKWYISMDAGLLLKKRMIDEVEGNPNKKVKALAIWDFLTSLPTYDTNDFPEQFYKDTNLKSAENLEYTAKFDDLNFENVT